MQLMDRELYIGMKMLTHFKKLKRLEPKKPHPDVGWMYELFEVARSAEATYEFKSTTPGKTSDELFNESQKVCQDCFDPTHARVWADALSKPASTVKNNLVSPEAITLLLKNISDTDKIRFEARAKELASHYIHYLVLRNGCIEDMAHVLDGGSISNLQFARCVQLLQEANYVVTKLTTWEDNPDRIYPHYMHLKLEVRKA